MPSDRAHEAPTDWSSLIGGLAHEIKNPLSTINLNLQMLREDQCKAGGPNIARSMKRIDVLLSEVSRLERMLADFQRLISNGTLDLLPTRLNQLVQGVLEVEADEFRRRNVVLSTNFDAAIDFVELDQNLVRQALLNLLLNAMDALDKPRRVITVNTRFRPGVAAVEVIDTGSGMSPETLQFAFHAYFSTKTHGTGLGLPMVKRIAERHGGRIVCETSPGVGTRVCLEFPLRNTDPRQ